MPGPVDDNGRDVSKTPAAHLTNPDKEGWLTKQGSLFKTWKRRWFVLKDGWIYYYKTQEDESPAGVIQVDKIHTVKGVEDITGTPYSFEITVPGRVYQIIAENKEEMNDWIRLVGRAIVLRSRSHQEEVQM